MVGICLAALVVVCMPILSTPLFRIPVPRNPLSSTPQPNSELGHLPSPWSSLKPIQDASRLAHRSSLRVFRGVNDIEGKYSYVVALLGKYKFRTCTGTLIAPTWVLTAAHCDRVVHVQYGDMTVSRMNITTTSDVLKWIPHPGYRDYRYYRTGPTYNDIAMMLVQKVPVSTFGVLSALDYRTLVGCEVQYAGLGATRFRRNRTLGFIKPVRVGFGMVRSCTNIRIHHFPEICVAPKCTNLQTVMRGDSGGPLILDGKVAGINAALYSRPVTNICTPVSPFISWIQEVMNNEG